MPYSKIGEDDIVRLALADSNINTQDLGTGFAALTQAIYDFVLNGHSVTLDGLGNFRLTCKTGEWDEKTQKWKSAGKDNMDDVSTDGIKGVYVRFRPMSARRCAARSGQTTRQILNRIGTFKRAEGLSAFGPFFGG